MNELKSNIDVVLMPWVPLCAKLNFFNLETLSHLLKKRNFLFIYLLPLSFM